MEVEFSAASLALLIWISILLCQRSMARKQRGEMPYRDLAWKLGISKSSQARLEWAKRALP